MSLFSGSTQFGWLLEATQCDAFFANRSYCQHADEASALRFTEDSGSPQEDSFHHGGRGIQIAEQSGPVRLQRRGYNLILGESFQGPGGDEALEDFAAL